jgi:hypothetical protein
MHSSVLIPFIQSCDPTAHNLDVSQVIDDGNMRGCCHLRRLQIFATSLQAFRNVADMRRAAFTGAVSNIVPIHFKRSNIESYHTETLSTFSLTFINTGRLMNFAEFIHQVSILQSIISSCPNELRRLNLNENISRQVLHSCTQKHRSVRRAATPFHSGSHYTQHVWSHTREVHTSGPFESHSFLSLLIKMIDNNGTVGPPTTIFSTYETIQ